MTCCKPNRMLCCNLRTGVLTWAITRLVLMLLGIPGCVLSFRQFHGPFQLLIASIVLGACIFWTFFYSLLIHGVRKDILCIFIFILVMQELEAITVLIFAILSMIYYYNGNDWGPFCGILFVCGGIIITMQWFVIILRAYYLERKREREASFIQFTKKEENEEETQGSALATIRTVVPQADMSMMHNAVAQD